MVKPQDQRAYAVGTGTSIIGAPVQEARDPTNLDVNYIQYQTWQNTSTGIMWQLVSFTSTSGTVLANWVKFATSATVVQTLTGNSGGAVGPTGGNINVVGDGTTITISGNPGTSTLTASLVGGSAAIEKLIPDSGTSPVVPDASGQITDAGSGSITTVGGLNSITTQLTGLTNHNVLVGAGTSTITKVPPSTAGFVLTSNGAAADPSFQAVSASGAVVDFQPDTGTNPVVPNGSGLIKILGQSTPNVSGIQVTGALNELDIAMFSPFVGDFTFTSSTSGDTETLTVSNSSNTASSQAQINAVVAGTTAGDAWNQWTLGSSRSFSAGIDTSDGGANAKFKINTNTSASVSPSSGTNVFYYDPTPDASAEPQTPLARFLNTNAVSLETAAPGQELSISCTNDSFNVAGSHALIESRVAGASGTVVADAWMATVGNLDWSWGESAAVPASPVFKFGHGGTPSTLSAVFYSINASGVITFGNSASPGNFYSFPTADGTAGQVLTTNGAGQLSFANSGEGSWTAISANQTLAVNNGYFCTGGGALSLALPAVSAVGDTIDVVLDGSTSWTITQPNAATRIRIGNQQTTLGVGGSLASTAQGDTVRLVCETANARWAVVSMIGNITVV